MDNEMGVELEIKMVKTKIARLKKELAYHKCKVKTIVRELEEAKNELKQVGSKNYIY